MTCKLLRRACNTLPIRVIEFVSVFESGTITLFPTCIMRLFVVGNDDDALAPYRLTYNQTTVNNAQIVCVKRNDLTFKSYK